MKHHTIAKDRQVPYVHFLKQVQEIVISLIFFNNFD
jgi:hypothetical protein